MSPLVMPVVIAYRSYPWIRVGLQSFRRHFPFSPILVIDNNPDRGHPLYEKKVDDERQWLSDWRAGDPCNVFLKTVRPEKKHGFAMDFAAQWCRSRGILWMLHFEPDCLISGVEWVYKLLEVIRQDMWMVGSHRKVFGPIHPTPSIWDVHHCTASFEIMLRGDDVNDPMFTQLVDMEKLQASVPAEYWPFWSVSWDTAQKTWYEAAKEKKDLLVDGSDDFQHFWQGSTHRTDPIVWGGERVREYL